jgi:hypothetical protein
MHLIPLVYCCRCWEEAHFPCKCADVRNWHAKCDQDGGLFAWLDENIQKAGHGKNVDGVRPYTHLLNHLPAFVSIYLYGPTACTSVDHLLLLVCINC